MKPLQYYKKQIFIMGCLGMFPMLVFAQETLSSANGLHGDYSGSRVERSADGDKLDIEFSIGLVEKLKSQQMMYISPRFVSVDGKKSVELANQNYDVTSNRYKNDLALLTDMLDASNMKLSADLGLVNARINVVYSFYKMKYITHTL